MQNLDFLPVWACHKKVQAAQIRSIGEPKQEGSRMIPMTLELPSKTTVDIEVPIDFIERHKPEVFGYLVRYEDGYCSFSPRATFESGYKLEAT